MPTPEQCPECARFLSKAFVGGLADADAPCPKCGTTLTGAMFGVVTDTDEQATASVRPPDVGVLDGWDRDRPHGGDDTVVALPTEAAMAVGIVCAGAGFVIARRHPVWGAVLGAVSGVIVAAIGRSAYQQRGA